MVVKKIWRIKIESIKGGLRDGEGSIALIGMKRAMEYLRWSYFY
jgi:hypothetical protein